MSNAGATARDSPGNRLPIELIRHIVADIDGDDMSPTLAACSLVCRSWSGICIFQAITVDSSDPASRLSFLYFTAPHLSVYILDLTIHRVERAIAPHPFPYWTPECFSRLKNLRSLELADITREWSALPAPLALGIATVLSAPHLRKLRIEDWHFRNDTRSLLFMLSLCSTSLEDLQLVDCDARSNTNDEGHALSPINLVALSTLRLDYVDHPALTESLIQCPNLKAIETRISNLKDGCCPLWVPSGVERLRLLAFSWTGIPTFQKTTHISALSINWTANEMALSDFGEWVERCINGLPHPGLLTELTLEHDVELIPDDDIEYPTDYSTFCRYLARLLDRRTLIRIGVSITITLDYIEADDAFDTHQARELERPKDGFTPVLGSGVDVRIRVQQAEYGVVLDCRV